MSQDLLFENAYPPLLLKGKHHGQNMSFWRPKTLAECRDILKASENFRLQRGCSERRVEKVKTPSIERNRHVYPMDVVSLSGVKELNTEI